MADREVTLLASLRDQVSGPLSKIGATFFSFRNNLDQIGQRLSPLTSRVGAFVTGLLSVRAAQGAIAAAKSAVEAETQLLSALKGRRDLLEQIQRITSRLQDTTVFDSDKLNEIATLFINAGVAVKDINDLLTITTDVAAGTGKSLETIARGLALLSQGESAGAIARIVPEIRDLLSESEGGAKAITLLRDRFKGAAAAIAATDFGKATQAANRLEDQEERLGSQLVKVKVAILQGAIPALTRLADALETPEGQAFLALLTQIVAKVTEFAPQIISVILTAQAFSFAKWLAPFLLFAAKLVPVVGLLTLVLTILEQSGVSLEAIGDVIGQVLKFVVDLTKAFLNGAKSAEDLFDVFSTRAKQAGTAFFAIFINPIIQFFKALVDIAKGSGQTVAGAFTFAAGKVAQGFGNAFEFITRGIAKALDAITNKAADLLEKLPGVGKEVADKLRTSLEASVPKLDFGSDTIAAGSDLINSGVNLIKSAIPDAISSVSKGLDDAHDSIGRLEDELDKRMAEREKQRIANSQTTSDAQAKIELEARKQTLDDVAKLEIDTQKVIDEKTKDLRERRAKRELEILRDQLASEQITFEEFIAKQTELELKPIQDVIAARELAIKALEDEKKKLVENKGEVANILALTRQILKLTEDQSLSIEDAKDKEAELNRLRAQNVAKRKQETAQEINDLVDSAVNAREIFDQRIESIRSRVSEGFLFSSEGADQEKKALDDLNRRLEVFSSRINDLLEKNPELAGQFADLDFEFEALSTHIQETEQSVTDLARGFEAGATKFISNAADMRQAGLRLGETVASSGSEIVDAFFEADFSFLTFASNFLKTIAKMIAQLLLFKGIASVLGIGVGANTGGLILGFADGGRVPGPLVNRDVVDAKLTPGEYVHNTAAVDYYGVAAMQALNRRLIPRSALSGFSEASAFRGRTNFADGGPVTRTQQSGSPTLVADNQTMERLLAGGRSAVVRFFRENPDILRSTIGASR